MLNKLIKRETEPERDVVVILQDNGSADIATIISEDDEKVSAVSPMQDYVIPVGDLRGYIGSTGKIFTVNAPSDYIQETKRLAKLEKSMVLSKITEYNQPHPEDEKKIIPIREIIAYAFMFILLMVVVFK